MSAGAVGHTPGPWVVVNPGQFLDVVSADTRKLIVPVWPDDHGRADAALIAAAPDLLAALRDLLNSDGTDLGAIDAGLAAVAKAEGRADLEFDLSERTPS